MARWLLKTCVMIGSLSHLILCKNYAENHFTTIGLRAYFGKSKQHMRKTLSLLAVLTITGLFGTGCAHVTKMEEKFGRGMGNSMEIVRMGEFRRTIEQTTLTDGPEYASTTGFVRGINRTLSRTGIGIWEMISAPFPPYHPLATDKFAVSPVYPDNFKPGVIADSMTATDTYIGFSGGEVLPMVPGSRFRIFEGQ